MPQARQGWDELQQLLDDTRASEAAGARARERWLRQQAAEEASLAGTLLDLSEQATPVSLCTVAGRTHQGRIAAVARDFCVLRSSAGRDVYVMLDGIASVRPAPGLRSAPATGDRSGAHDLSLAELLARVGPLRPRVTVRPRGDPDPISGELRAVGADVMTVHLDGPSSASAYVSLASLVEVIVDTD